MCEMQHNVFLDTSKSLKISYFLCERGLYEVALYINLFVYPVVGGWVFRCWGLSFCK